MDESFSVKAYQIWLNRYFDSDNEKDLEPFLNDKITQQTNWLRKTRQNLLISTNKMSEKLNITSSIVNLFMQFVRRARSNAQK